MDTHSREIEAVRHVYAGLNRNDIPAALTSFDPAIERVEFEGLPGAGTYRGIAAVTDHFAKGRETWAEGACTPERFIAAGDKIVVFVHVRVRLKAETDWREGAVTDVFAFGNGKITQFRTFADRTEALAWAGATDAG
jgi:ketosteroid isomerase-like protein